MHAPPTGQQVIDAYRYVVRIHTGITRIHDSHMHASHVYTTRTCMHHTYTRLAHACITCIHDR